jgi:hypothetical protein
MTMTVRKQLSAAAWGASALFCLLLLVSAYSAVSQHAAVNITTPSIGAHP